MEVSHSDLLVGRRYPIHACVETGAIFALDHGLADCGTSFCNHAFSIAAKIELVNSWVVELPPMSRVRDLLLAVSGC